MSTEMDRLLATAAELAQVGSWELDLQTGEVVWSDEMYRLLGLEPGDIRPSVEALLTFTHPDDRERLTALLDTIATAPDKVSTEGVTGEFRLVRPEGSVRDVRVRGRLLSDSRGPAHWVGAAQDVTEQRLTERELLAHYGVSQALRSWESFDEGVMDLLRRIGTALDYPMGSLWLWSDEVQGLRCRAFWHAPDVDPRGYDVAKRSRIFKPGEGKPGLAWALQEPIVTADAASDPRFQPREAALQRGVTSGVAFPAVGYDGPVAVLSYYSFEHRIPSESLVRTLTSIGRELGRFLSRRRAQLEPSPLTPRELQILKLAADGLSGPQIAERLIVSPSTVKTHFENIYEKLGVSDRASAVALALRTGLIQ